MLTNHLHHNEKQYPMSDEIVVKLIVLRKELFEQEYRLNYLVKIEGRHTLVNQVQLVIEELMAEIEELEAQLSGRD